MAYFPALIFRFFSGETSSNRRGVKIGSKNNKNAHIVIKQKVSNISGKIRKFKSS